MPEKYGILVGVDGSAESDAAVRWATREAILRDELITLLHVVAPVIASWPMSPMQANITGWQKRKTLRMSSSRRARLCAPRWAKRRPRCTQRCCIRTLCRR